MNLRDQLLKAGLVDKKRADQVQRDVRKEAKIAEGNQAARAERERVEAEAREAREAERRAREATLAERRREQEARIAVESRLMSTRQTLRAHRIRIGRGTQRFWHRSPDGREAWRLDLPEWVADDLRLGRLAIAWCDDQNPEVLVVDALTANRVEALRPELILFRNRGAIDTDPSQQLYNEAEEGAVRRGPPSALRSAVGARSVGAPRGGRR